MNEPRVPEHPPAPGAMVTEAATDAVTHAATAPTGSPITLPIITESIDVRKVDVDHGGYRFTKHVEERDVLVDLPLWHETVAIERRALNRELADHEMPTVRHEGNTMIVPVVKEIVVTQIRRVLVEEIHIARKSEAHRDPQSVTVREEHIEIERLGAETSVIRSS